MIIRRQGLPQNPAEDGDEISIDFERLGFIVCKQAGLLAVAALLGLGLGLVYPLYQFSKPVETRLETEILFVGSAGATGVTGVTGIKEVDSVLSTFDPQINLQNIIQRWPDWPLLGEVLEKSDFKRVDSGAKAGSLSDQGRSGKAPAKFLVQDSSGGQAKLLIDFQTPRNKPVRMIIQGAFSEEKIKILNANVLRAFNKSWSQQALELAQTLISNAEKVRAQLGKEPSREVENFPRFAQSIQISADFSLFSNYQKIRLIDQFLEKLQNWPAELTFAYNGKQSWEELLPSKALWLMPLVLGAGFLIGILAF